MKRTGPGVIIVAFVLGAGAGFVLDQLLTSAGRPTYTPVFSLPILLAVLAGIVVVLAIPIRRATHGSSRAPVNPFRAVRVAMLAKASSLVGAVCAGFSGGLVLFLLSRPAEPSLGSMGALLTTLAAAALLVAGGLVAEHLCTIRKDDDDEQRGGGTGSADPGRQHPGSGGPHPAH